MLKQLSVMAKSVIRILPLCLLLVSAKAGEIVGKVPIPRSGSEGAAPSVEKYRGKISGKVSPFPVQVAAVWLEGRTLFAPSSPPSFSLAQENYQFVKSLIVVPRGATVAFPNKDQNYHNIYSLSKPKRFDLGRYKANETPIPKVVFDKPGFVALNCEIHDHMKANIIVVDTPYYTTTSPDGSYRLKNIPPGNYTLSAQISRRKKWKEAVTVTAKGVTRVNFASR